MEGAGQRRPTKEDLSRLMDMIWEGNSLRSACEKLGLHVPSTSTWLQSDEDRREQYVRAREGRAEALQEEGLTVTKAAAVGALVNGKKVDAGGARAYLDAIKWAAARMAPKTAPVERHHHTFGDLTDAELAAQIEAMEAQQDDDD